MELYVIVSKLVGDINPTGRCHTDIINLCNLETLIGLLERLLFDIETVAASKDKCIGMRAKSFLNTLKLNVSIDPDAIKLRETNEVEWYGEELRRKYIGKIEATSVVFAKDPCEARKRIQIQLKNLFAGYGG